MFVVLRDPYLVSSLVHQEDNEGNSKFNGRTLVRAETIAISSAPPHSDETGARGGRGRR